MVKSVKPPLYVLLTESLSNHGLADVSEALKEWLLHPSITGSALSEDFIMEVASGCKFQYTPDNTLISTPQTAHFSVAINLAQLAALDLFTQTSIETIDFECVDEGNTISVSCVKDEEKLTIEEWLLFAGEHFGESIMQELKPHLLPIAASTNNPLDKLVSYFANIVKVKRAEASLAI